MILSARDEERTEDRGPRVRRRRLRDQAVLHGELQARIRAVLRRAAGPCRGGRADRGGCVDPRPVGPRGDGQRRGGPDAARVRDPGRVPRPPGPPGHPWTAAPCRLGRGIPGRAPLRPCPREHSCGASSRRPIPRGCSATSSSPSPASGTGYAPPSATRLTTRRRRAADLSAFERRGPPLRGSPLGRPADDGAMNHVDGDPDAASRALEREMAPVESAIEMVAERPRLADGPRRAALRRALLDQARQIGAERGVRVVPAGVSATRARPDFDRLSEIMGARTVSATPHRGGRRGAAGDRGTTSPGRGWMSPRRPRPKRPGGPGHRRTSRAGPPGPQPAGRHGLGPPPSRRGWVARGDLRSSS